MVQKKMDVYSTINHFKYEMLDLDPQGPPLKALQSTYTFLLRQDDERVQAVRVDAKARQEVAALFKYQSLASMTSMLSRGNRVKELNEDLFITQLVVRAAALDFEFQVQRERGGEREREGGRGGRERDCAPLLLFSNSRAEERKERKRECVFGSILALFVVVFARTRAQLFVHARPRVREIDRHGDY